MKMNSAAIQRNDKMGRTGFYRINAIALLIAALIALSITTFAATYEANLTGNFNNALIWTPSYPGNIINETDTVYINNHVKLSTDIVIKGTVIIKRTGSLMGDKNVVVLPTGSFINFGISIMDALNNNGLVFNRHILEVALDFINSGTLMNQESMVVGNIIDNTGMIAGNGGNLIANKKFVNSQSGSIRGNLDICSNNFQNVDGGTLDSVNLRFCGTRIFGNLILSADFRKERILINLLNSDASGYKEYKVERSIDGINYETIATVKETGDKTAPIKYIDKDKVNSNSVYYRMRLTTNDNREEHIPPVELGNTFVSELDASKF